MNHRFIFFLLLLLFLLVLPLFGQNPFLQQDGKESTHLEPTSGGIVTRSGIIADWSRSLQESIASLSRRVRDGEWAAGVVAFLASVLFGVVHIAGPGHGKVFAISYFAGRGARQSAGITYSVIVNAVDSLSAFAVVMLGYVVLRAVLPTFRTRGPLVLQLVSYGLIVAFGIIHLASHVFGGHHHDGDEHLDDKPQRPPWLLALSVGLVPCPVSTVLLVYGVVNNVLPFMILMVVGVSLGGFITMSLISAAVIGGRSWLFRMVEGRTAARVTGVLEYVASGAIVVVGALLFVAAL